MGLLGRSRFGLGLAGAAALATALVFGTLTPAAAQEESPVDFFVDDDDSTFEENINFIAARGITRGCNPPLNDLFCPDDPPTRGQVAAFLVRALSLPSTDIDFFDDDEDSIFEAEINRIAAAGITNGCNPPDNTMFCPDDPMPRAQLAAFLVRGFDLPPYSGPDLFADVSTSVFKSEIHALAQAGVTRGCNPPANDLFCPNDVTTRGEIAAFLARAISVGDDVPTVPGDTPPVAVGDEVTVAEDAATTTVDVLANDTDADGDPFTVASATQPTDGTVVVGTGGGDVTYQPDPDFCGPDTFEYTLDPGGDSAVVSVTVTCVDDLPVAVDDEVTVAEDAAAATIDVLANDTEADGDPFTVGSATQPANGTVVVTNGGADLTYQPDPDFCGPDTFEYTLDPGGDGAVVSVTVTCVNEDPVAVDDSATVGEDAAATTIDVLGNDTDGDGDPFTVGSVTQPANGNVVVTNGGADLTYQPDPDFCGPDTFEYTLDPGGDTGLVSVTVTCVDDSPVAEDDSATLTEDAAATTIDVLANDTDADGDPFSIGSVTQPANGTVVVTNGGADLSYTPDPNYCNSASGTPDTFEYTLDPGGDSAVVSVTVTCVNDAPVADDESFAGADAAVGNTALVVDDPTDGAPTVARPHKTITGDLLDGDVDVDGQSLVVVAGTITTSDGGSATVEADGDFVYTPAAGTSCTDTSDSFSYTVSDQNPGTPGTDTGTVTIDLSGCVWYVDNTAAGEGTSTNPFATLAEADAATPAGDAIFVFAGTGATVGYGTGVTLGASQILVGEAADLVIGGVTLHTGDPGARPILTNPGADVVELDDGNLVTGLEIGPQGAGSGIVGGAGDNGGTIANVVIASSLPVTQPGLELNGTSGTWGISDLAVTTSGATGIALTNAGTVNFAATGTNSITTAGAPALVAASTNMSTSSIHAITVTNSASGAVSLTNTSGTTNLTDLDLTTTSGATPAFLLNNAGTVNVAAAGTANITATGGPAVDVTNSAGVSLVFDAVTSTNSASDGINLDGLGTGTFTASSGIITNPAGIAFDLNGGSGNVTYSGSITDDTGTLVEVTTSTGGSKDFNGAITDGDDGDGNGIVLTNNTGATIRFDGGVTLSTGASPAFTATGGGTVNVTGATNTLTTTTATALNITNTTIGGDGVTFQAISANGAASGIILNNTGTSGGLTITGDGDGNPDGGGGTIQNTTGHGITLTSTMSPSLTDVTVSNAGDGDNEYGLLLTNVGGTTTLDDMTFNNAADNLVYLTSTTSSTFNVTGSVFTYPGAIGPTANSAILLEPGGDANLTASVTSSTFTDILSASTQIGANTLNASGTLSLTFSNNTINSGPGRAGGVVVSGQELTTTSLSIGNNTFTGAGGNGVISIDVNDGSTVTGTVSNNTITNPPGIGIFNAVDEDATSTLRFQDNTITNAGGDGIQIVNFGGVGTSTMNATLIDNTVDGHSGNTAVSFVGGISVTGFEDVLDLELTGNIVTGTPGGATQCGGAPCVDYYLEEVGGAFRLEEIPDTPAMTADAAYVNATNDPGPVTIFGVIDLSNGVEITSS